MSLSVGIVGIPNAGKSTLFNALLQREIASVAEHPFTTVEPNTGVVEVPDERLKKLAQTLGIKKIVPAIVKFIDIAGLVKEAHKGEGLGNQFLSHIRSTDAILHVVRDFENLKVSHPRGKIDPFYDITTVNLELVLADFEMVAKSLKELKKKSRQNKKLAEKVKILKKLRQVLEDGQWARETPLSEEEKEKIAQFNLLTAKPVIYVLNTNDEKINQLSVKKFKKLTGQDKILVLSAKLEAEIGELEEEEREEYLEELGLKAPCLLRLIREAYHLLGLITFYTVVGGKKAQAWPIKKGTTAIEAAGKIHTDLAKSFIKAEVINWQPLVSLGSWNKAKEAGKMRVVGKDYQIRNGDVLEIKFH